MATFIDLARWAGHPRALPPGYDIQPQEVLDDKAEIALLQEEFGLHPISAFTCVIEYDGEVRLITCRRYDLIGDFGYVGAICHLAGGYRQFRCDRIEGVFDALTGEALGTGRYFDRFEISTRRDAAQTWGLTSSQKTTLVAGLNVLAFMARCDGYWHLLETPVIESFICSMWLRKEWDGEPSIDDIVAHAQRLSPDSKTFFKGLQHYSRSKTSTRILCRAVADLIAADGVICLEENTWGTEIEVFFQDYNDADFDKYFLHAA